MNLYAVKRPGVPLAIMVLIEDVDPMTEALKGGPVEDVAAITEADAAVIRASRPPAVLPLAENQSGMVTRAEMKAEVQAAIAQFAQNLATETGGAP